MPTLFITEAGHMGKDGASDVVPVMQMPALANQAITISSTSAQSAALNAATTIVLLQSDTDCWVVFGANPTATALMMPLPADVERYLGVPKGAGLKIAAITA
jgi:hypothetical protein